MANTSTDKRIEHLAKLLGKTTARLRTSDRAAAEALVKAGQDIIAAMRAGEL